MAENFVCVKQNRIVNIVWCDEQDTTALISNFGYDEVLLAESQGNPFMNSLRLADGYWQPPSPYPSWRWNNDAREWEAPVPLPDDTHGWTWDEQDQKWVRSSP